MNSTVAGVSSPTTVLGLGESSRTLLEGIPVGRPSASRPPPMLLSNGHLPESSSRRQRQGWGHNGGGQSSQVNGGRNYQARTNMQWRPILPHPENSGISAPINVPEPMEIQVAGQHEREINSRLDLIGRHTFRIMPFYTQPLLLQMPRNAQVVSFRYLYHDSMLTTVLEIRHMLSVLPWGNGSFPQVIPTPLENMLENWTPTRRLEVLYPPIEPFSMRILAWNARGAACPEMHACGFGGVYLSVSSYSHYNYGYTGTI